MRQPVTRLLSRARWGAARGGPQGGDWRRVPKINLLPGRRAGLTKSHLIGALVAVLVIAAVFLFNTYMGLSSAQDQTERNRQALQAATKKLSVIEEELQNLITKKADLEQKRKADEQAILAATSEQIDWGASLSALLSTQGPGVRFEAITTKPDSRAVEVAGVATDVNAMVVFQSYVANVSDLLDLQSLRWQEGDSSLNFVASFMARHQ